MTGSRLQADIAGQLRVRFDLATELLPPGEAVLLTIKANSSKRPNPTLEVLENCYQTTPVRHTSALSWNKGRTGTVYTAKWRWHPPHCGNYQIRWRCDVGGDILDPRAGRFGLGRRSHRPRTQSPTPALPPGPHRLCPLP